MIPAQSYYTIYLILVTIITLITYFKYDKRNGNITYPLNKRKKDGTFILVILMVLFIGYRPANFVFVDMMNYITFYHALYVPFCFRWHQKSNPYANSIFCDDWNWTIRQLNNLPNKIGKKI